MQIISSAQGFISNALLSPQATRANVIATIKNASANLTTGDIFFLSYSGHGGQVPDINGDEDDGQDETWCLFDGQLIDDELHDMWLSFKEDVRILIVSDSCHSGTVTKFLATIDYNYSDLAKKYMPDEVALNTYMKNKQFYDQIQGHIKDVKTNDIRANVRLISGCQDNQSSYDGTFNSLFTEKIKVVWNGGKFSGNYAEFHRTILKLMPPYQSPNHFYVGKANFVYDAQEPFTI